jgi:hypothetical protein
MPTVIIQYLLALVLLVSQAASAMHQADVEQHAQSSDCAVCLAAQGNHWAVMAAHQLPIPDFGTERTETQLNDIFLCRAPALALARSPPLDTPRI